MAHIVAVCQSQQRTDPKVDVGAGELRAGHGLVGDAHAGLSERQVSLLAVERIERANREHSITAVPGSCRAWSAGTATRPASESG